MRAKNYIKPGSSADIMLATTIRAGEIKRYKLRYFLPGMSNNGFYKAYNKLLAAGYIEERSHRWLGYGRTGGSCVYVSATLSGRMAFAELYGQGYVEQISPNISKKQLFDRQSKEMDIAALFEGRDMAYLPGSKPTLNEFLSLDCGEEYAGQCITHGIAYFSKEIKAFLKEQHFSLGTNVPYDSASGSRFFALLFYHRHAYVIYNTGTKAMLWSSTTEHRLKAVLCKMINDSAISLTGFFPHQTEQTLCCIMVCSRKIGLSNVLAGRGYKAMGGHRENSRQSFTLTVLLKDYSSVALVPMCGNRNIQFQNALDMQDEKPRAEFADKLTTLYPSLLYAANQPGVVFADGVDAICYALPYLDIGWLMAYKGAQKPAYFVVPKTTQESISKFMGPLALGFFDMETMQPLYARKYTSEGEAIRGNKN
jgi:hypothetical protein